MVPEHDRWTVYSSKVNLPAALNDPRLAKRESDFFTKTWGLDFAEAEVMPSFCLPNITREHFGPYVQEMAQVNATAPRTGAVSEEAQVNSEGSNIAYVMKFNLYRQNLI